MSLLRFEPEKLATKQLSPSKSKYLFLLFSYTQRPISTPITWWMGSVYRLNSCGIRCQAKLSFQLKLNGLSRGPRFQSRQQNLFEKRGIEPGSLSHSLMQGSALSGTRSRSLPMKSQLNDQMVPVLAEVNQIRSVGIKVKYFIIMSGTSDRNENRNGCLSQKITNGKIKN